MGKGSCCHTPGVTALQLTLQPLSVTLELALNNALTTLVTLVMLLGRVEPQVFFIKGVPSPSVIVRLSKPHLEWGSMLNAVNCNSITSPCLTCIVSVFAKKSG